MCRAPLAVESNIISFSGSVDAVQARRIGANIEETPDGMIISGVTSLQGGRTSSHGDHRLAMTLGIAGMLAEGETEIAYPNSTKISYPGFWDDLEMIAQGVLVSNER